MNHAEHIASLFKEAKNIRQVRKLVEEHMSAEAMGKTSWFDPKAPQVQAANKPRGVRDFFDSYTLKVASKGNKNA